MEPLKPALLQQASDIRQQSGVRIVDEAFEGSVRAGLQQLQSSLRRLLHVWRQAEPTTV